MLSKSSCFTGAGSMVAGAATICTAAGAFSALFAAFFGAAGFVAFRVVSLPARDPS